MEFLTRINLHIPMGHFEIDLEDGRVRFVVSQLLERGNLSAELTLTLMRRALDRVETFFPVYSGSYTATFTPSPL